MTTVVHFLTRWQFSRLFQAFITEITEFQTFSRLEVFFRIPKLFQTVEVSRQPDLSS
jgi:hypothetical protein